MGFVDTLDRAQRKRSFLGVPVGVFFKFVDDQGPYLAAIVSFYATLAIFPILLLATSIFGFVLQGNPDLQEQVLNSTLATFPIIGEQLGRPERLQGSTGGVIVGVLAATYGSLGLGQALQNALNVAWSVPRNNRPNPDRAAAPEPRAPADVGRVRRGDHDGLDRRRRVRGLRDGWELHRPLVDPDRQRGARRSAADRGLPARRCPPTSSRPGCPRRVHRLLPVAAPPRGRAGLHHEGAGRHRRAWTPPSAWSSA